MYIFAENTATFAIFNLIIFIFQFMDSKGRDFDHLPETKRWPKARLQ